MGLNLRDRMPASEDWEDAVRMQEEERRRQVADRVFGDQKAVYDDANGMMNAVRQKQAQQTLGIQYSNATLMKLANGGMVPQEAVDWWNTRNGGGANGGATLSRAGYDGEGTFHMVFAGSDGQEQDMMATPLMQYQMANNMRGIFGDADRAGMHDALLAQGHSEQELSRYAGGLNVVGGTTDGKAMSVLAGRGGDRHSRISVFAADGNGGFSRREYDGHTGEDTGMTDEGTRAQGKWVQTGVGPSDTFDGKNDKTQVRTYRNTMTGETVRVKDGETPPWEAKANNGTGGGTGGGGSGNWHENVARINAESREKVAGMKNTSDEKRAQWKNDTAVRVATIGADGKVAVADTNANALLEKTNMQIRSYAEKNVTDKEIANIRAAAQKWCAGLRAKSNLSLAKVQTESKERIAKATREAQKAIAEGRADAWLAGKQLDYDAKIEAIEASKMSDEGKRRLTERLAAERNAITLKIAEMRNATEQGKLELGWEKEKNNQANAGVEQSQGQQRIDETVRHNKEMEKAAKERIAALRRDALSKGVSGDALRDINRRLDAAAKVVASGSAEARKKAVADIDAIEDEIRGDKAPIKRGYNGGDDIRTDSSGRKWRIVRDKNGKPVGKQPVQ